MPQLPSGCVTKGEGEVSGAQGHLVPRRAETTPGLSARPEATEAIQKLLETQPEAKRQGKKTLAFPFLQPLA